MRKMLIRRFGQNRRILGIATLAIAFLFCVYLYYDLLNQLKLNDERNQRLKALQNSLSTQLQGLCLSVSLSLILSLAS